MAVSAQSVINVLAGTGSDNSGGGFSLAGNTYGITDLAGTIANTTTPSVSSASYTFVAGDVGHYVHIASGTNWLPGLYPIASVAAGAATLGQPDPAVGSWAGVATVASPASGSATVMRIRKTTAFTNGTNLTVDGTTNTKVNPDGYTITNADVGNWIQITTTGTGAAFTVGFYQITAVTLGSASTQRWTLDRSPAAVSSAGATWAMGGALTSLAKANTGAVASNKIFFAGSLSTTATITFAQSATVTQSVMPTRLIGFKTLWGDIYQSAPGTFVNNASRPVLTLATNTGLTAIATTGAGFYIENVIVNCAGLGTSTGLSASGNGVTAINCQVMNFTSRGISFSGIGNGVMWCEVMLGTSAATFAVLNSGTPGVAVGNFLHDNACPGLELNNGMAARNLIVNCSGASSDGLIMNSNDPCALYNNTVYNSGRDNIALLLRWYGIFVRNNLSAKAGRYGINFQSGTGCPAAAWWDGNAYWSNTTANRNNLDDQTTNVVNEAAPYTNLLDVAITADPFVRATVPVADLAVDASNNLKVTSGGYNFVAGDVGATIYVTTSTGGWNGPAEFTIASISGTAAILTASPGATSSSAGNWYFNNFKLNSTASAGASLRAGGTPGAFPGVSMLGFPDMGAAQHQDPAAPPIPPLIYGA